MKNNTEELIENTYCRARPFRTMWHLYRKDKWKLFAAVTSMTIKHLPALAFPIFTANIINIIVDPTKHDITKMWWNIGLFLLLLVQNIPMHMLFINFLSTVSRNMEMRLRSAVIRRLQALSISFHDTFHSGKLHTKVLRDVEQVANLGDQFVNNVVGSLLNISFALVMTISKQPIIALFYLVTAPVASIIMRGFRSKMRLRNEEFRVELETMSARVTEMIDLIPVTRAHGLEGVEENRINKQLDQVKKKGFRLDIINAFFGSSVYVQFNVFQVLCLGFTGYLAFQGKIQPGDVVMYQGFFGMILGSLNMFIYMYPQISKSFDSIKSLGEILESPDIEQNEGKTKVTSVDGRIQFDKVDFAYANTKQPAIKNLSLDVRSGECIAMVGESGSGKSTIMNLIIGFRRPTAGRILLDGRDMQELDMRTARQHLAVVSQSTILFSGTVRENITYGLTDVTTQQLDNALEMANCTEFISKLQSGLDTTIGERGAKLSGGQRQRIAIARALIRDPRIIIFDEATSALDVMSELLVQQAIERMIKNRTTFIVAHRLSTIRNADRIVVLKKGECIEMGTHAELMAQQGEFYRLRSLQV